MIQLQNIIDDFEFLDDWEERYKYVIDIGKSLPQMPDSDKTDANKVQGCASQVWLTVETTEQNDNPVLHFNGDSDAHIVRGLVAITLAVFSGQTAKDIANISADDAFAKLGLIEHLTPQRANGLRSMVQRIKQHAIDALS